VRLFNCQNCNQLLYFENRQCGNCGLQLGFLPQRGELSALQPRTDLWCAEADAESGQLYRFCDNAAIDVCNWMVAAVDVETRCIACRHNQTIPDLTRGDHLELWRKLEVAKHRLIYSLLRLGLPLLNRYDHPQGLAFDFLADPPTPQGERVITGHDNGLITIALREADDAERARLRMAMNEPYRTLLGHFRHEIGHYYWDRLIDDAGQQAQFRACFGDERADYAEALQRHYAEGSPQDWQSNFVSSYAAMHPWEDFAETWAHYLHIVDTLDTASAFGLRIQPRAASTQGMNVKIDFDPYRCESIERLIDHWLPLTFAVNSLNRSMGQPDLYPFILSPPAIEKLGFVHELIGAIHRSGTSDQAFG